MQLGLLIISPELVNDNSKRGESFMAEKPCRKRILEENQKRAKMPINIKKGWREITVLVENPPGLQFESGTMTQQVVRI